MTEKLFSAGEVISYGWSKVKEKFWFWGSVSITIMLVSGIGSEISQRIGTDTGAAQMINILFGLIGAFLQIGVIKMCLDLYDGKQIEYNQLFSGGKYFLNYLLASILVGMIVFLGFLLLLVPGIIWAIKYQFVTYLVIDKNMPIGEAMKKSAEMTKGIKWGLFGVGLGFLGVIILGAICLGVGLIWAIPVTWLGAAYLYRKLSKEAPAEDNSKAPEQPEAPALQQ